MPAILTHHSKLPKVQRVKEKDLKRAGGGTLMKPAQARWKKEFLGSRAENYLDDYVLYGLFIGMSLLTVKGHWDRRPWSQSQISQSGVFESHTT